MPTLHVTFTPSETYEQSLERAAELFGIEREYWDIWGKHHVASDEGMAEVLRSMGVDSSGKESLDLAVESRLHDHWSRILPPTVVTGAALPFVTVHLPANEPGPLAVSVRWEDGTAEHAPATIASIAPFRTATIGETEYAAYKTPLPFPAKLGYHELSVSAGSYNATARLIVCPERAYFPSRLANNGRAGGMFVSLYGLRSERNWGCGDFTDLKGLIDWMAQDLNASFIGLNPLHAIANRQPYNTSPYLPLCAFYKNLIYLDIEAIEDFRNSRAAQRAAGSARVQAEMRRLRDSEFVEYEDVQRLKLRILRSVFRQFMNEWRADTERARAFRRYMEAEGELLDRFAVYSALDEWIHRRHPDVWLWKDWPAEYQDPDSPATHEFTRAHWRTVLFHKYLQWQIDLQMEEAHQYAKQAGLAIGLYHDLALATDRYGADLWAHRRFYIQGCRVGAPPDDFSPEGQDWSFPPPNAEEHHRDGYRLFAESIRKNLRHGGALRIDHVMRFFHLFWIPDRFSAKKGIYVRDRHEDLVRILALESVRNQAIVVGEDLGTVADDIRETLARFGILSYRLFYFERWPDGTFKMPDEYPKNSLVSISTHDLPTIAGFWDGRDIEARRAAGVFRDDAGYQAQLADRVREKQRILDVLFRAGLLPDHHPRDAADIPELTAELHHAVVGFLARTPSLLMLLNEEDLMKQEDQQNLPGTTYQYPNWRHKTRFTVEELRSNVLARGFTKMYQDWLAGTGRANG